MEHTLKDGLNYAQDAGEGAWKQGKDAGQGAWKQGEDAFDSSQSFLNNDAMQGFEPPDSLVWESWVLYAALGAGCTIPWFTFISAVDYFQNRYPDTWIIRVIVTAYLVSWLISYALLNSTKYGRHLNSWTRIWVGLSISGIALLVPPILELVFITEYGTNATYWVTVGVAFIAGAGDATAQGSLLGIGSELPARILEAIITGIGATGVLIFIVRVVIKLIVGEVLGALRYSAVVFFFVSALLIFLFEGAYVYVHKLPEIGYFKSLGLSNMDNFRSVVGSGSGLSPQMAAGMAIATVAAGKSSSVKPLDYKPVFRENYLLTVSLVITYITTLFIYPGFLAQDTSTSDIHEGWYPILFVGTYVVFEFLGRLTVTVWLPKKHSLYLGLSVARLVIVVPIFVLGVAGVWPLSTKISLFILVGVLALTHGILVACLMIRIPKSVSQNAMEAAGVITGTISVFASIVGISLSWLWLFATGT